MTDTPEPASAADSAERINAARAEQRRLQRVLQLEERLADERETLERRDDAVQLAERRLDQARLHREETNAAIVELERELTSLQPPAPEKEGT